MTKTCRKIDMVCQTNQGTDWIRNHHTQGILLTIYPDAFDTNLDEAICIHWLSLNNILALLQTPGTYKPPTNKFWSHCQQWCLLKVSDGLSYYTTGNTTMKTLHNWDDYRWKELSRAYKHIGDQEFLSTTITRPLSFKVFSPKHFIIFNMVEQLLISV